MKKSMLLLGAIGSGLIFLACENEYSKSRSLNNEVGLSKVPGFDYVTEVRNVVKSIDLESFVLNQLNIDKALTKLSLEGKDIVTVQFIQDILEEGEYVKQYGLESFYRKYELSEFTIQQLLKMYDNQDISSLVNEPEFNSLPQNEKLMLLKSIEINQNILMHSNQESSYQAKDGEYALLYGSIGQLLGTIISPGFGTAIGWAAGTIIGTIVDQSK